MITINFNGTNQDLNDFCLAHNYQDEIDSIDVETGTRTKIPNPENKQDFFIRTIQEWVWNTVKSQRALSKAKAARKTEMNKTVNF